MVVKRKSSGDRSRVWIHANCFEQRTDEVEVQEEEDPVQVMPYAHGRLSSFASATEACR